MTNSVTSEEAEREPGGALVRKQHIKFFQRFLHLSPAFLASNDCSRLTIAFFALSGLDVLSALDTISPEKQKHIIEWIYNLQIIPNGTYSEDRCGFQGSSSHKIKATDHGFETGHLAMTYTGLASLVILGDDLSRVDKKAVLSGVKALQQEDGSFCGTKNEESDMRFVYCAACISYILNDITAVNLPKVKEFITSSISYDGGIAQGPQLESHGGSTFCGVAALQLFGEFENTLDFTMKEKLKRWCINRQETGFQGRPNKPVDTCYSFWVGGTLRMLECLHMVDFAENRRYIMSTQDNIIGGFSKWPGSTSDPLHAYLGLCSLSLMKEEGLRPLEASLNITERAHAFLKKLHDVWDS